MEGNTAMLVKLVVMASAATLVTIVRNLDARLMVLLIVGVTIASQVIAVRQVADAFQMEKWIAVAAPTANRETRA